MAPLRNFCMGGPRGQRSGGTRVGPSRVAFYVKRRQLQRASPLALSPGTTIVPTDGVDSARGVLTRYSTLGIGRGSGCSAPPLCQNSLFDNPWSHQLQKLVGLRG